MARLRKLPLQEFVERFQVVDSPVLPRTNLTQITPQLHEPRFAFIFEALHRSARASEPTVLARLPMALSKHRLSLLLRRETVVGFSICPIDGTNTPDLLEILRRQVVYSAAISFGQREHGVSRSRVIHEERSFWTLVMFIVFVQGISWPEAFSPVLMAC